VILSVASKGDISKIQDIVIADLARRASIVQMLVKYYNREGLSSPRNQILALTSGAPPKIAAARALAPAPPAFTTRPPETKPRDLQMNTNVLATAAQYRVEKVRDPLQPQPFRRLQWIRPKPQKG
jgi:hypothetical protein